MSGKLEFTDTRFISLGRQYPGIPVLVSSSAIFIVEICAYFRDLVIRQGLALTSAKTYAEVILQFWNFLEKSSCDLKEVDDRLMIRWLNEQKLSGVSWEVRNSRKNTIFEMYVWLEINNYVRGIIRLPESTLPVEHVPQLSSIRITNAQGGRYRGIKYGIISGIKIKDDGTGGNIQNTPILSDVAKIQAAAENAINPELGERNQCIIDWYYQVGLRRVECLSLKIVQIPCYKEIYELVENNEAFELKLNVTKGGKKRYVGVLPELLERTREYIEGPRRDIVNRFKNFDSNYSEPLEIFLSNKTGFPLELVSVTNLLTALFRKAGVPGHGHRLRATFLCNLFEAECDAEEELIKKNQSTKTSIDYELVLRKVAERAGHRDIDSLRSYLNLVRKRRQRDGFETDPVIMRQQIDAQKTRILFLEAKIAKLEGKLLEMSNQIKR